MEPNLVLQFLGDQVCKVVQNPLGLDRVQSIDLAGENRVDVDRLPARNGIGPDDRVDGIVEFSECLATGGLGQNLEDVRGVGGGEALEKSFDGLGEIVVELVAV